MQISIELKGTRVIKKMYSLDVSDKVKVESKKSNAKKLCVACSLCVCVSKATLREPIAVSFPRLFMCVCVCSFRFPILFLV